MTAISSRLVNGLLSVKPLANFAKHKARKMMMDRAETIGVYWRDEVKALKARGTKDEMDAAWEEELRAIANPTLAYPRYYTTSFHAYEEGNLGWLPAMEVDVAARAVHARIWPEGDERAGINGDASLRQAYHKILKAAIEQSSKSTPSNIVDLGCGVGASTRTLQDSFPGSQATGVDLSPYFLTVAQHTERQRENSQPIRWTHAAAENTGLPTSSADLVSACLMFHELPTTAAQNIISEAYRLLRPDGYFGIMDMNPQSEAYSTLPPYVLTLLKSTEPYLDQYFELDMKAAFQSAGFTEPQITVSTPRHRAIIGQKV